jgi:hypothetical protein
MLNRPFHLTERHVTMVDIDRGFFVLDAGSELRFFMVRENIFFAVIVMTLPMRASRKTERTDL